jgi:flagellar biosynthesis protein FlhG
MKASPISIAVGGGKGGVGKSVFSILLGQWLARLGKSTVIVDLDLGGANIHTLLGIKSPPATIQDLISRRVDSLEEVAVRTEVENLRIICGASEILSAANPVFAQKLKIMRKLNALEADFLVLDLGAGTSFDVLDFFLAADEKVLVATPEPISIYNAYGFLRNSVYRRLFQIFREYPQLTELVRSAMDPKNELNIRNVRTLIEHLFKEANPELLGTVMDDLKQFTPGVVVNQVRNARERNTPRILQQVAERYLTLSVRELGSIVYDPKLQSMVSGMVPLTSGSGYRGAYDCVREIASEMLIDRLKMPPQLDSDPLAPAASFRRSR